MDYNTVDDSNKTNRFVLAQQRQKNIQKDKTKEVLKFNHSSNYD